MVRFERGIPTRPCCIKKTCFTFIPLEYKSSSGGEEALKRNVVPHAALCQPKGPQELVLLELVLLELVLEGTLPPFPECFRSCRVNPTTTLKLRWQLSSSFPQQTEHVPPDEDVPDSRRRLPRLAGRKETTLCRGWCLPSGRWRSRWRSRSGCRRLSCSEHERRAPSR